MRRCPFTFFFFFFNDTATTEIYTLSLHDALPIYSGFAAGSSHLLRKRRHASLFCSYHASSLTPSRKWRRKREKRDRKSTRLNSSHSQISYAVFCLKKKKNNSIISHDRLMVLSHYD